MANADLARRPSLARALASPPRAVWVLIVASAALSAACAGKSKPPETTSPPAVGPAVTPPAFTPAAAAAPLQSRSPYAGSRAAIFEAAWTTVRDKHYDPTLGGVDWDAQRKTYEPMALGAPDQPTFYRIVNQMLGELRQSHLFLTGPGDEELADQNDGGDGSSHEGTGQAGSPTGGPTGDPGLEVREIQGKATITVVKPNSPADQAGLRPGFVVTHVGGKALQASRPKRPLRPVEERFYLRRAARTQLQGPAGTRVTVRFRDAENAEREVALLRVAPEGQAEHFGNLGPLFPRVKIEQVGDVGIIRFNFFLLEPVLAEVNAAIERFRKSNARAIILDLRGNPGGMAAMAIPIAARLVQPPLVLGTIQFRGHSNTLTAQASLGIKPYEGRVLILTDEGTASTSEILTAGLQEAKRATVVGEMTLGAALPSAVEQLPGGAILQYVVADFRTPSGLMLEGRGVEPDRRVVETRSALLAGRDVVMEAALELARSRR